MAGKVTKNAKAVEKHVKEWGYNPPQGVVKATQKNPWNNGNTGLAKAGALAGKAVNVPAQGNKQGLSGSLQDLKKAIDKTTSKRDPIQKHPLVRNTGEASAEGKYRTGSKVPVKGNGAKIRTSAGIAGEGGRNVSPIYRPSGGGGFAGGMEHNFGGGGLPEQIK